MLDRFMHFLKDLPGSPARRGSSGDDPRVAAAALLFHVMDADGVRERAEIEQLRPLVAELFDIDGQELARVVSAGEKAEEEAIDLYGFTSVINRHLDHKAKLELVSLMWEMVFADGELHELEDNLVWRAAELLHVERDQRIALRQRARHAEG
jgi:uncharacterized tellurite resistance protein B-like protein